MSGSEAEAPQPSPGVQEGSPATPAAPEGPRPEPQSVADAPAHNLITSFSTFLTVCIHNILFYRAIYPQATFLSARAYNLPVHQSRHPKLCAWIQDAVDAVAAQLAGGHADRVAVVVHAPLNPGSQKSGASSDKASSASSGAGKPKVPPGAVLERWMFDVSRFPAWPGGAEAFRDFGKVSGKPRQDREDELKDEDAEAEAEEGEDDLEEEEDEAEAEADDDAEGPAEEAEADGINWTDVDEQLRGAVRRMAHAAEKTGPLPPGCTFTVAVELKEDARAPLGHPQPWIPAQPNLQTASKTRPQSGKDVGGAKTTPIRAVEAGPLFFECWVEEGKAKGALKSRPS